jgi:voltage-gated potassium channel
MLGAGRSVPLGVELSGVVDERSIRVADRLEVPLLVAALLTVPTTIVEESHLRHPWPQIATYLNWLIWLTFLAEVLVMLAVVPSRKAWLRKHPLELAIVILTPPALLTAVQPIRLLRLLRVFRLLRLAPLFRLLLSEQGLQYAAALAMLTAIAGGAAFSAVEKHVSVGNGIYWALVTMTTVGYGDITPHTTEAKVVAVFVMMVGIGTATLVIGAVAQRFVRATVEDAIEAAEHDADQDVLLMVRDISERLAKLEGALQRQRRAS